MDEPDLETSLRRATTESRSAFAAALEAKRPDEAAALYAEDARLLAPSADVISGRAAIEAFWRAGLEAGISKIRLEPTNLECRDGAAYEIGRYRLQAEATGSAPVVDRGSYLLVHRPRAGGTWCWAIQSFNPDNPSPGGR